MPWPGGHGQFESVVEAAEDRADARAEDEWLVATAIGLAVVVAHFARTGRFHDPSRA